MFAIRLLISSAMGNMLINNCFEASEVVSKIYSFHALKFSISVLKFWHYRNGMGLCQLILLLAKGIAELVKQSCYFYALLSVKV